MGIAAGTTRFGPRAEITEPLGYLTILITLSY